LACDRWVLRLRRARLLRARRCDRLERRAGRSPRLTRRCPSVSGEVERRPHEPAAARCARRRDPPSESARQSQRADARAPRVEPRNADLLRHYTEPWRDMLRPYSGLRPSPRSKPFPWVCLTKRREKQRHRSDQGALRLPAPPPHFSGVFDAFSGFSSGPRTKIVGLRHSSTG
jgi:hypothetical protein